MKKLLFAALLWSATGTLMPALAQDSIENERVPKRKIEIKVEKIEKTSKKSKKTKDDVQEALFEAEDEIKDAIEELEEAIRKSEGAQKETLQRSVEQLRQTLNTIRQQRKALNDPSTIHPTEHEAVSDSLIANESAHDSLQKSSKDSTIINMGKRRILIDRNSEGKKTISIQRIKEQYDEEERKPKNFEMGLFALDLGFNTLLDQGSFSMSEANRDFELRQGPSLHVTTRFLKTRFNLAKNHLHLVTALEFDFQNYKFRQPITLEPRSERFDYRLDTGMVYRNNKLSASYFQIPLMLHFTAKNHHLRRSFRLSAGGYAGILLDAWTKQVRDDRRTTKTDDRYHLDPIRYGLSFRIGYGSFEFYTNYNLNPLFRKNEGGPDLTPLCFGIKLVDF